MRHLLYTTLLIASFSLQIKAQDNTPLVPAWALGHIIWEDSINTEQGAQRLQNEYASHGIPVDGIIIDSPWSESYNDFNWDRQRYPHAEQMIKHFDQQGVKVILWLTGCVNTVCKDTPHQKAANYDEAVRLHYGINNNTPSKWWKGEGLQIDFTNPKARDWWYTQLDKVFIEGVYGFKVDQGETYFGDTVSTSLGKMTNRDFRRYYYGAMSDYVRARMPEGITISRPYSHQGGIHSTPDKMIVGWCGDFGGDWKGLKLQINNIYQSAQAGYGAVGCEVAGFMGAKASREDFIRYAQFGCMTACMINGGENGAFSSHLPWYHGNDVSDIYRNCVTLHNQLRPYLFSALVEAHLHGGSLLRNTSLEEESHLLGNDIFTKAITSADGMASFRLPDDGEWVDYFTGEVFHGGTQVNKVYPLDRFPLFIRKGAIIPMDIDGKKVFMVYPQGKTTRKYHMPLGEGTAYQECTVSFNEADGQLEMEWEKPFDYKVMIKK
jgi:alpha-glucosidase (family GH31 glycosyl hydrolase)